MVEPLVRCHVPINNTKEITVSQKCKRKKKGMKVEGATKKEVSEREQGKVTEGENN